MSYTALVARIHTRPQADLLGLKFGKLKVVGTTMKYNRKAWSCQCKCGTIIACLTTELRAGKIQKCKQCKRIAHNRSNLLGRRFGWLTVLTYSRTDGKILYYICQCDCGEMVEVRRCNLGRSTNSCGCSKKSYIAPPPKTLFAGEAAFRKLNRRYQVDAKRRGWAFTLSEQTVRALTSSPCTYCGVLPATIQSSYGGNGDYVYNGIDRKDSNIGYELDNVVACCRHCNFAKRELSEQEFLNWVVQVYHHMQGEVG